MYLTTLMNNRVDVATINVFTHLNPTSPVEFAILTYFKSCPSLDRLGRAESKTYCVRQVLYIKRPNFRFHIYPTGHPDISLSTSAMSRLVSLSAAMTLW